MLSAGNCCSALGETRLVRLRRVWLAIDRKSIGRCLTLIVTGNAPRRSTLMHLRYPSEKYLRVASEPESLLGSYRGRLFNDQVDDV